MNKHLPVHNIMTQSVVTASENNTMRQVLEFFHIYKVQHLPVVDGERLVGVVSVNDVLDFLAKHLLNNELIFLDTATVKSIMTENPTTVTSLDTIASAVNILGENRFQALPVTEGGKLRGIVTNNDIVKHIKEVL